MGIRIQPLEIEVPKEDPFKYDLLDRKEQVEALTNVVSNIEGPCVLAVDAAWGTGKTTFIRIWDQYLQNRGFPVVRINAWETDFSGNPFVALTSGLTEGFRYCIGQAPTEKIDALKKGAKEVLRKVAPGSIRLLAGMIPVVGAEVGNAMGAYAEEALSDFPEAEKSIKEFRKSLKEVAVALSEEAPNRPLVVFIDELDRCRPSYAIEFLEVAKHLFSVDKVVFVLAVHRQQLAHSIRAVYGAEFDAERYLGRFFDADFQIPSSSRAGFINGLLQATQLDDYFNSVAVATPTAQDVSSVLVDFFGASDLGLRDIAQAVHRLGLVLMSLSPAQQAYVTWALVALIIRTLDSELYKRFIRGEATDRVVVDMLATKIGRPESTLSNKTAWIEPYIILGAQRIVAGDEGVIRADNSPLMDLYKKSEDSGMVSGPDTAHARRVLTAVERLYESDEVSRRPVGVGFTIAVERLELLSGERMEDGDK